MMKPKITLVRNEEPEEEEEELEEEEQVEEIKPIKKEKPKQVNDEYSSDDKECIVYGSIQHRVAYATDYNIAAWIKRNGHELGPYFDYNFCEEE